MLEIADLGLSFYVGRVNGSLIFGVTYFDCILRGLLFLAFADYSADLLNLSLLTD